MISLIQFAECTFIILDAELWRKTEGDEVAAMVGDTNLFFSIPSPGDYDERDHYYSVAEIEIMIAEKSARRKGKLATPVTRAPFAL